MQIALVTYQLLPDLEAGDQLLRAALQQRGHRVTACSWDDAAVPWQEYDGIVIRSTWDYHKRISEFLAWVDSIEQLGIPLWNPPTLLRWNYEKSYLLELAGQGVACVPTEYLPLGSQASLPDLLRNRGWDAAVVKPAIAATSFHTWRTDVHQATSDQQRLDQLLAERAMLIQPLMPQIYAGEWSLVFVAGQYSHAVLKRPAAGDFRSQDDFGGSELLCEPPATAILQAHQLLEQLRSPWLFARVDGLMVDTTFTLMEIELIEPALFLSLAPFAAQTLAIALERLIEQAG
jgi:glutathione synthase/RimK-type ligase-like ATP-grasp enzyme